MKIKRYAAQSMEQALQTVKADLGPAAIILETRRRPRVLGLFGRGGVEVVAAVDPLLRVSTDPRPDGAASLYSPPVTAAAAANPDRQRLIRCGLFAATAAELLAGDVRLSEPAFLSRLERLAIQRLGGVPAVATAAAAPAARARTIALVGPTGAGKTTTLAKLAAQAALVEGKQVALITLDTYRVGAVDQLRIYANILEVPLFVAYSVEELQRAVYEAAGVDLILIDTAGRAPADALAIGQLRQALEKVAADEVHLVVAATVRSADAEYLARTYGRLSPSHLLLTKLDETLAPGGIFELPAIFKLPVSYFTFGQSVPDDIERASPRRAVDMLIAAVSLLQGGGGAGVDY